MNSSDVRTRLAAATFASLPREVRAPAQRAPYLFTFVFAALVSLAPIGGEGRGGVCVDAEANRRRSSGAREDGFNTDILLGDLRLREVAVMYNANL